MKEKLDSRYIKWALLAVLSAYFVTFPNGMVNFKTGEGTIIAALYALGAAFAWGLLHDIFQMLLGKVRAEVSTFYRFLITVIISLPILFLFGRAYSQDLKRNCTCHTHDVSIWFLALIAVSTGMACATLFGYKGLAKTPVHVSTILELVFPLLLFC